MAGSQPGGEIPQQPHFAAVGGVHRLTQLAGEDQHESRLGHHVCLGDQRRPLTGRVEPTAGIGRRR